MIQIKENLYIYCRSWLLLMPVTFILSVRGTYGYIYIGTISSSHWVSIRSQPHFHIEQIYIEVQYKRTHARALYMVVLTCKDCVFSVYYICCDAHLRSLILTWTHIYLHTNIYYNMCTSYLNSSQNTVRVALSLKVCWPL